MIMARAEIASLRTVRLRIIADYVRHVTLRRETTSMSVPNHRVRPSDTCRSARVGERGVIDRDR